MWDLFDERQLEKCNVRKLEETKTKIKDFLDFEDKFGIQGN